MAGATVDELDRRDVVLKCQHLDPWHADHRRRRGLGAVGGEGPPGAIVAHAADVELPRVRALRHGGLPDLAAAGTLGRASERPAADAHGARDRGAAVAKEAGAGVAGVQDQRRRQLVASGHEVDCGGARVAGCSGDCGAQRQPLVTPWLRPELGRRGAATSRGQEKKRAQDGQHRPRLAGGPRDRQPGLRMVSWAGRSRKQTRFARLPATYLPQPAKQGAGHGATCGQCLPPVSASSSQCQRKLTAKSQLAQFKIESSDMQGGGPERHPRLPHSAGHHV